MRGGVAKRALDVFLGTLLVLVALPAIILLSLGVCLSLRTWQPFFLQRRVGRGGRPFTILKLRTLPLYAPPAADKYTIAATIETTRFARLLRATHLDELPQLLLVPLGRMSLVGPRPEMPSLLARFDPPFVAARSRVRPGCTGLWQISADADRLIGEAPEYDLYYLQHASARLDAWVLWKSVVFVISGRPVSLAEVPTWARGRNHVPLELARATLRSSLTSELSSDVGAETMPASG